MAMDSVKEWSVEGKIFLVTGGAAGVGSGLVRALLSQNARHVAYIDVSEREGEILERELVNKFGALRAKFIKCDIADDEQLVSTYKQLLDKYHRIDAVINNAAMLSTEAKKYKRMVDINFTATVTSTLKALSIMGVDNGGGGGVIVNVSSLLALKPNTHLPLYAATKTAVLQFTNSLGTEENFSRTRVRMMTVCLGPTDTAILQRHRTNNLTSRVPERQKVESAVTGIMEVIRRAESGSTWIIANDKPAVDVTDSVIESFKILARDVIG